MMKLLLLMALFGIFAANREVVVREEVIPIPEVAKEAEVPQLQKELLPKAKEE